MRERITPFYRKFRSELNRISFLGKNCLAFWVILFLLSPKLYSQSSNNPELYKINLERVKNQTLKVSYYPQSDSWKGILEYPYLTKGFYWPLEPGKFIKGQSLFNSKNEKIKGVTSRIKKMELSHFSSSKPPLSYPEVFVPEIRKKEFFFLNPILLFGKDPDRKNSKARIEIKNPNALWTNLKGTPQNAERLESTYENFKSLYESFLWFSNTAPTEVQIKKKKVFIWGLDDFPRLNSYYKTGILTELFEKFITGVKTEHVNILLRSGNVKEEPVSNLVSKSSIIIKIPQGEDPEEMLNNFAFGLSRYWVTQQILGPLYWKNYGEPQYPGHLWLIESMSKYLAIQSLVNGEILSENWSKDFFLVALEREISGSNANLFNLGIELYQKGEITKEKKNLLSSMNPYFNRGVLTAFYLDILLREKGVSIGGLYPWLERFSNFCANHPSGYEHPDLWGAFLKFQDPDIKSLVESYVYGDKPIPHDFYLNRVGWDFVQKGEEHRTFLKGGKFHFFPEINHYVCVKKGKNTLEMEKGDIIISINNNEVFNEYDLRELLFVNQGFRRELSVKVLVLRNGKELVLRGKATKKVRTRHNEIMPNSDPLSAQYQLRQKIL